MAPHRTWCAALVIAPVVLLSAGEAEADPVTLSGAIALPHGVRLGRDGRYYQDVCDHDRPYYCMAHRLLPESYRPGDSIEEAIRLHPLIGPSGSMAPSDVQAAYALPAGSGAGGKTVALIDMPDSHAYADLTAYRQAFGLPALPQCPGGLPDGKAPCFAQVDENGNPAPSPQDAGGMFDTETGLDIEMVAAACPDCSILLVGMTSALSQGGPTGGDFAMSAATATRLGAVATSMSFGGPETGGDPTGYTTPGHLMLAASGDTGYLLGGQGSPSYPASAPDVLAVGGTTLQNNGGGYSEVVWNDQSQGGGAGGSGCSTEFPMPPFQTQFGASHFAGCSQRDSVDVSAAAEFFSGQGGGIAVYDSGSGGWMTVTGTSAACPLVAAVFTRLGVAEAISSNLGFVYTNASAFNDVTSGSNGSCGNIQCTAGPGWDGPTGVGTPNGSKLQPLGSSSGGSGSGSGSGSSSGTGGSSGSSSSSSGGSSSGSNSGGGIDAGSGSSSGSQGGPGSGSGTAATDSGVPSSNETAASAATVGDLNSPAGCGCASVGARPGLGGLAASLGLLAGCTLRRRRRAAGRPVRHR